MTNQDVFSTHPTHDDSLHHLNCDPIIANIEQIGSIANQRHYTVKKSFINRTTLPVVIQERIGLSISLPAMPLPEYNNVFIVRLELDFHSAIRNQVELTLNYLDDTASNELKVLKNSFNIKTKERPNGNVTVFLDYPITLQQIKSYGGSVYLKEMDVVVSIMPPGEIPDHPANIKNYDKAMLERLTSLDSCLCVSVDVVDNDGTLGTKYMRVGTQVYKITPKVNKSLPNGIYVNTNSEVNSGVDPGSPKTHKLSEDEFQTFGIFSTYDQARSKDDEADRRTELIKLEHDLHISRNNANLIKADHDKEMLQKETELKRLTMENEKLLETQRVEKARIEAEQDIKMMGVKNYYDSLSYTRKDESEVLKFLPTLILGVGAAFMAFTKFFK